MSITIATLKAAGLTAEQIVAVLEAKEADERAVEETARLKNRDRMRAARASRAVHIANDHAQHEQHAHKEIDDSALSSSLTESQKGKKEEKKERAKRDRGTVCPDDFLPSEVHFEAGARQGVSRMRVQACCAAMKDWSKSNSHRAIARKVDWSAALFGWISREAERTGKVNGHRTIMEAADDLLERVLSFDAPAPSGFCDGAGADAPRLLSKG